MQFNEEKAKAVAKAVAKENITSLTNNEISLVDSFVEICKFLHDYPESLSWRGKNKPSIYDEKGLKKLAQKYFSSYKPSDFPAQPNTVPDEFVSIVMHYAYGYPKQRLEQIKIEHQYSMCAENCVGALLERYYKD